MNRRIPTILALAFFAACSSSAPPTGPAPTSTSNPPPPCAAGAKTCEGACVAITSPEVGCAGASCAPCRVPHASAACSSAGECGVGTCENGFGDCNGERRDGCEVDVTRSDAHCGACGAACPTTSVCRKSACVDRNVAAAEDWLATQSEAWCSSTYNQLINLCGDVDFCFDARFMREYPTGVALDVGFAWESPTETGNVAQLGGDCNGQRIAIFVPQPGVIAGAFASAPVQVKLGPGKHLVSFQINATGTALFVDGALAAVGAAPTAPIRLLDSCGPGLILGQRISYWWESAQRPSWGRSAPFFVQLREGVPDVRSYTVARATSAGSGTAFLFDKTGAKPSSSTWAASVGGLVGVAKNSLDETPQLDAGPSGPLPTWRPLSQCALR